MKTKHRWKKGYTFAEVLVASALVGVIVGGAVKLMGTMNVSEAAATNGTVTLNLLDSSMKLWRLGLTAAEVNSVLPAVQDNEFVARAIVDYSGASVSFSAVSTVTLANSMGTLETVTVSAVAEDPQGASNRTFNLQAYRPLSR